MPGSYGRGNGEETWELRHFGLVARGFRVASCGDHQPGELGPGAQPELAVDVGEVGLDRAHAEIQGSGDLLVRSPVGRERGDAPLALAELLSGWPPAADPPQLGPRLVSPQRRGQLLEDRQRPE